MSSSNRAGFLGLLLVLSAITAPGAQAATSSAPASIDERLSRISAALRERQQPLPEEPGDDRLAFGFLNGPGLGWGNAPAYGGFGNYNPYYGGFGNGGFGNYRPAWGNGGFVNGWRGGFRNW
ncbi:MAG: GrrA/OscA1 family cyclophane-containing rSAM-modified RiPP [Cyanobacteriota bacterium]|jgi:rSAM-associated Gly-rich repeat protein|nr:rSAM-associated Gly-rich repeat protein [Synechococcus sp. FGCU3]MEB3302599.1 GrrA/OscA1 family cyclophane-containing rSAM-modified RiPP [Cyanobacteriota bacterium]